MNFAPYNREAGETLPLLAGLAMNEMEMRRAVAREDLCRLTAACYYEPDPAFEEAGLFDSLLAAARLVDDELVQRVQAMADSFRTTPANTLLLDYTRLFLGPMDILAKPYGSVWLTADKTLMGETSMAVLAMYEEGGLELDEEFRELPDHIAAELEFLYLLIFRESEAQRLGDKEEQNTVATLKQRFLQQHLGQWVRPFTAAMRANAQTPFYRNLSALTERLVGMELART